MDFKKLSTAELKEIRRELNNEIQMRAYAAAKAEEARQDTLINEFFEKYCNN
tara:strand:- start:138 stop:293 length:156 start_codon:yes stop_codon:yes gene_type:complete